MLPGDSPAFEPLFVDDAALPQDVAVILSAQAGDMVVEITFPKRGTAQAEALGAFDACASLAAPPSIQPTSTEDLCVGPDRISSR